MKNDLIALYLEYVNDYLTIGYMAQDKGIDSILLADMIKSGKKYHEDLN